MAKQDEKTAAAAPAAAPAPSVNPAIAALDPEAKLAAAKAKLAKLQAEKELDIVNAEIEKLQHGGKEPGRVIREKAAEKVRDATFTEVIDGKAYRKYRIPGPSFKPDMPGRLPRLREPGFIVTVEADALPGETWEPIQKVPDGPAVQFATIKA